MAQMTGDEWKGLIREAPRPAIVAVVRADGRPHCTPTRIDLDRDQIVFTTAADSLKGKVLRHDTDICIYVGEDEPRFNAGDLSAVP